MIPATAGWRVVVVELEHDGVHAMPIVAWDRDVSTTYVPRGPGEKALEFTHDYLIPFAQSAEAGDAVICKPKPEHVVGYLAPGDEMEEGWIEQGKDMLAAIRAERDRDDDRDHRVRQYVARGLLEDFRDGVESVQLTLNSGGLELGDRISQAREQLGELHGLVEEKIEARR